jgi:pSer/pThr/pTyr-binding forkhead associated (FHA) protein
MAAEVSLTITQGLTEGQVFVFRDRTVGAIGRSEDCLLRLPGHLAHRDVSRHHCLLDIDPPEIRVRDLGSKNGTYVNEASIGQRDRGLPAGTASAFELPDRTLEDGDELRVGVTVFRVGVRAGEGGEHETSPTDEGSVVLVG